MNENFLPALLTTVLAGGVLASGTAKTEGEITTAQVVLAFDAEDTAAATWARVNSALLVKGVSRETRKAMAELIALGFENGVPPRRLAKQLQPLIGLTARDAASLAAADLSTGARAKLAKKMLKRRATTIARTESIKAANEGQRLFWRQAVRDGLLTGGELREWIVTPDDRLCPICEPMAGQRVGMDDDFETGDGGLVSNPPAHPDCRCAVGLTAETETSVA